MYKVFVFLLLTLSATLGFASKTTLTGTITDGQGNGITGVLLMRLPVPAQDTTTSTAVSPGAVSFNLVNGAISGGAQLYDVANLQPSGLYYIARAYDVSGALQFYGNFVVTGPSFNLGAATPTNVTTSNISYVSIGAPAAPNTWTAPQTFTLGNFLLQGSTSGTTIVNATAVASGTIIMPAANDTLVARNTTDTLTNKTLTSPVISSIVNTGTLTLPTSTDTLVGRATTDTLSNKSTAAGPVTGTVASGTAVMTTAAIGAGACGTTVTVAAANVATTDAIAWAFNAAPAANPAQLVVSAWPTSGNVNFQYCNPSAGSITPNAATLNFRVPR